MDMYSGSLGDGNCLQSRQLSAIQQVVISQFKSVIVQSIILLVTEINKQKILNSNAVTVMSHGPSVADPWGKGAIAIAYNYSLKALHNAPKPAIFR